MTTPVTTKDPRMPLDDTEQTVDLHDHSQQQAAQPVSVEAQPATVQSKAGR